MKSIQVKREMAFLVLLVAGALVLPVAARSGGNGGPEDLELLARFETFESLGFSPDGVTYGPPKSRLFIASAGAEVPNLTGIFEVTQKGELVRHIPLPPASEGSFGYSITRATSGPHVGHFFLANFNSMPTTEVLELDEDWNLLNSFEVTGSVFPGDGMTFNHLTQNLAIIDLGSNELFEVTTTGEPVRSFSIPCMAGVTFNIPTGTYFGVCPGATLFEMSTAGELIRFFDLRKHGILQPVGIGSGQGKLFIGDEIDVPNSGGFIYIFRSPRRAR